MKSLAGTSLIPAEPNCVQRFFLSKAADVVVVATCITFLILSILATLPQLSSFLGPGSDVIWCALFVTSNIVAIYVAGKIAWRCREHLIEEQTLIVIPVEQTSTVVPVEQTSIAIPAEISEPADFQEGNTSAEIIEIEAEGHPRRRPVIRVETENINYCLRRWSAFASVDNVKALEEEGAFLNSRMLCEAANQGYSELVKKLVTHIDKKIIIEGERAKKIIMEYDTWDYTVLHEALICSDRKKALEMTQTLLDLKCAPLLVNRRTRSEVALTPLHLAVTPLSRKLPKTNNKIVKLLLDKGADVNLKDLKGGNTPLHCAVAEAKPPNIEMINLLVKAGAFWNVTNAENKTPLQTLQENHREWYNDHHKELLF